MPEVFTRHYLGGWASLAFEPVRELAPYIHCFCGLVGGGEQGPENDFLERVRNYHTATLPYEQFNRIPFQLWFREHFSIPYIPFHLLGVAEIAIAGFCSAIAQLHRICPDNHDARYLNYVTPAIIWLVTTVPLALTAIVLSLPIFVMNVIINRVIEPIVSWVRESCCGCDPMVEL
jgi:hypothetical protein